MGNVMRPMKHSATAACVRSCLFLRCRRDFFWQSGILKHLLHSFPYGNGAAELNWLRPGLQPMPACRLPAPSLIPN